jgi:hypothetical protein
VNLKALGERQIIVDCDVILADGGTRCASITGGYVALAQAIRKLREQERISRDPIEAAVAAVSVGVVKGQPLLDIDYSEDSSADVDFNVVMTDQHAFVEIQGTAEKSPFTPATLDELLVLASTGLDNLFEAQKKAAEDFVGEYLLDRQAAKENMTVAQLLEKHVNITIAKDPTEDSPVIATGPICEECSTWVPPHSSTDHGPPISTIRTVSS